MATRKRRSMRMSLNGGGTDSMPSQSGYCRVCQLILPISKFYQATDTFLDKNGYMSVCKDCCNSIFEHKLSQENDNVHKALSFICKELNVAYIEKAVESAILQINNRTEDSSKPDYSKAFGVYKSKLANYSKTHGDIVSLTYEHATPTPVTKEEQEQIEEAISLAEGEEFKKYLVGAWGSGLSIDDYNFLENALNEWKTTHKCDTNSELILMREICHLQLAVRKAREDDKDTKTLVRSLQDLIKTANLSPAQAGLSAAGKGNEVFGMWIKDIEQLEPAEWWDENRDLFKDVDNLSLYWDNHITRAIKNFITRSRDFVMKSSDGGDIEFELKEEIDGGSDE